MNREPTHRTKTPDTYHYHGQRFTIRDLHNLTGIPLKRLQADLSKHGYTVEYAIRRWDQQKQDEKLQKMHKSKCAKCMYRSSHGGRLDCTSQECMYLLDTGQRRKHHGIGTCDSYKKGTPHHKAADWICEGGI